jgi:RecB family endonuclease NucS
MVSSLCLLNSGEFILHASEDDMHRAILLKTPLFEEGFKPISWEKHVEPGFVDIYGEDKDGKLVIIEVKRRTASKENVLQLAKYIEPIKAKVNRDVRAVLVAPTLAKDVQALIVSLGLSLRRLTQRLRGGAQEERQPQVGVVLFKLASALLTWRLPMYLPPLIYRTQGIFW